MLRIQGTVAVVLVDERTRSGLYLGVCVCVCVTGSVRPGGGATHSQGTVAVVLVDERMRSGLYLLCVCVCMCV